MAEPVAGRDRAIILAPGLKSCCVATLRAHAEATYIGDIVTCWCTSSMIVNDEGVWVWVTPVPHAFCRRPGERWDDFCWWYGCNAGPDAEVHMVSRAARNRWAYREGRMERDKHGTWLERYGYSDAVLGSGANRAGRGWSAEKEESSEGGTVWTQSQGSPP